jgi:hypothetical protein
VQRNTKRLIVAIAVIALLAAGGAAFTASIGGALDGQNANIGVGSETVKGAQATAVNYVLSSNGQFVDQVSVTLTGDYSSNYTFVGNLTDGAGNKGAGGAVVAAGVCTPGSFTSGSTVVTCDFTAGNGPTHGTLVDTANGFELSVTGNDSTGTSSNFNGS